MNTANDIANHRAIVRKNLQNRGSCTVSRRLNSTDWTWEPDTCACACDRTSGVLYLGDGDRHWYLDTLDAAVDHIVQWHWPATSGCTLTFPVEVLFDNR